MNLTLITEDGVAAVEGRPGEPLLATIDDTNRLVETCWSEGADAALLYAANLMPGFFDLSSGEAGGLLQKLQNYRIRLAVVYEPGAVTWSSRFAELMAEAQNGRDFGVFASRDEALTWLVNTAERAPGTQ
jgi:hypothetical protein